ncbi:MAG: helix-turn-helix transcriptional regulator [Bifidobacteriaceae bacterium]|nr:helix-turn-helix transcriptional regulator [Bifidobacteriaceae bacterium]
MAMTKTQVRRAYAVCAQSLIDGRVSLDDAETAGFQMDAPIFTVGQTAELADIHPQTLRQYDRLGLIVPQRTLGGARRYSLRDVQRLTQAQHLSQDESINLAGITRILALMEENRQLKRQVKRLRRPAGSSVFAAGVDGEVVEFRTTSHYGAWRSDLYSQRLQITAPGGGSIPALTSGGE